MPYDTDYAPLIRSRHMALLANSLFLSHSGTYGGGYAPGISQRFIDHCLLMSVGVSGDISRH